ncbi:YbaB/EbfC family nucleoid-associated protein [Krasilnikovia sp. M28-CT-15]|uniref:YbaB/EbfC family nucleoid-associated protein n=1 Tax=Krasilnikovia sp. M28-CT-15 TaxID=3373540 RepID=UPI003876F244
MPLDPDDVVDDWARRIEQQTALTTELSERLQGSKASAESPGGEATVTVDHSGGLADLRLSARAMQLSPDELAEIILATSRRAQAKLAQQVTDLVSGLYGAGSETAAFIGGTYAAQFPEPDDQDEADTRR